MAATDLTAARLREVLHYDPGTGVFTRLLKTGSRATVGSRAGSLMKIGYVAISIDGHVYYAHRLAWLYVTGMWPTHEIDHRNGERADNKFANLREATRSLNAQNRGRQSNNTSGFVGVHKNANGSGWSADIKVQGVKFHIGSFPSPAEAGEAACIAREALHPMRRH